MVRVLAVADEEVLALESRARTTEVDVVVSAGDLPWDYLERLVELVDAPAVFVPGNHEPLDRGPAPQGMSSADQQVLDVAGLRIAGLGGCVHYNGGPHQHTQAEYGRRAERLARQAGGAGVDLVLTHAPPLGLGDQPDPSHVGIEALHGLVAALEPTWLLHGHIHPYGMHKPDRTIGGTTVRNVIPWQVLEVEPRAVAVLDPTRTKEQRW